MQCGAGARLDVGPGRAGQLGKHEVVLDVPLRREDQRLAAGAVAEPVEVLTGEAVQPGEPVGTGDGEHVAVAAVHQPGALGQQPLLAQRVAVVGGDGERGVGRVLDGDGPRAGQQGGTHGFSDRARSRHAAHVPDSATCPTSTVKPSSAARRSAALSRRSGATCAIPPQEAHTTCRWGCSEAW